VTKAAGRSFELSSIERASNAERTAIEHVGVDHCRRDVAVAEEFLNRANVIAGLLERSCVVTHGTLPHPKWHCLGFAIRQVQRVASMANRGCTVSVL